MAGDNERDQRSGNADATKASPLSQFFGSDAFLFIVLFALGALNFGSLIHSALGVAWEVFSGAIVFGIVVAARSLKIARSTWYRRAQKLGLRISKDRAQSA